MKRILTLFEEHVIRLCHHDFGGMTQQEAASYLSVSQKKISKALSRVKALAPQLFPILTKEQAYIRDCIVDEGLSHLQIAILQHISVETVDSIAATLKSKGVCLGRPSKTLRYETWMDKLAKRKF